MSDEVISVDVNELSLAVETQMHIFGSCISKPIFFFFLESCSEKTNTCMFRSLLA